MPKKTPKKTQKTAAKGWSEERRKAQAERCRQSKPWKKSTGPKTEEGKKAIRFNARKHGAYSEEQITLSKALSYQTYLLNLTLYNVTEKDLSFAEWKNKRQLDQLTRMW